MTDPAPKSAVPSQVHGAYLEIEKRIVTLQFAPNSLLTEKAIIEAVGYGRTPVREALQRLNLEGLVEIQPRLGIRIAQIRPEDYPRAVEPRLTLEPLLVRSAARFAGPRDRIALQTAMQGMLDAAAASDVLEYLEQDKAIDEAISNAAANPFLPRILAPLQIHSRRFWYQYHGSEGLMAAADLHAHVCAAIIASDAAAAEDATRELVTYLFEQSRTFAA